MRELQPGLLQSVVDDRFREALRCGALQPIETRMQVIEQDGIRFAVRIATNLQRKDAARAQQEKAGRAHGRPVDPFQPPEPELVVGGLSPTHFCLFNKYNVLDHHLLIVTRDYEDQETLISYEDFAALWRCLAEIDGLGFYNAGTTAGASQPHKHLQLAPLPPPGPDGIRVPIEAAFADIGTGIPGQITRASRLPFRHALTALDPELPPEPAAAETLHLYRAMLDVLGIAAVADGPALRQSQAYNLVMTRRWLLMVPRATERFNGISVNALNFAGLIFVRTPEQLALLEQAGPLAALAGVCSPPAR